MQTPFETILQLIGNHDCLEAKIPPLEVAAFLIFIQAKPYIDMDFPPSAGQPMTTHHIVQKKFGKKIKTLLAVIFQT